MLPLSAARAPPPVRSRSRSTGSCSTSRVTSSPPPSPQEPRARSVLPFVHVSLLREDRILPGLEELFEAVGSSLPSALAIVTGPSSSADIEQTLVVGVHGPGEVHVVLVDRARAGDSAG